MRQNKMLKKIVCAALVLTTALSIAGCGDKNETAEDEKIKLTWVMPGNGKQQDSEAVWAKFNEDLKTYKGFENVDVVFEIIPTAEYAQKILLMQSSGREDVDILGTYGLNFAGEVSNGTFIDLTDMMDEYAKDVKKEIPEWALQTTQFNGRQYTLPNYQQMAMPMWGYYFNSAKAADKYVDYEAAEKEFMSSDILTEGTLDIFEKVLAGIKADGTMNQGFRPGSTWAKKGYNSISGWYWYRVEADKVIIENALTLDTMKMTIERFHDWFKKGYIRKDILSADVGKGKYDINHQQWHKYAEEAFNQSRQPGNECKLLRSEKNFHLPNGSTAGGNGVYLRSKNPEKALSFLDLMYTEKGNDLYNLLVWGIEGQHYTKVTEQRIQPIGYESSQPGSSAPYGLQKWLCGNTANSYETVYDKEGWNDYVFNDWNANAMPSPITGIYVDIEPIKMELGLCNGVVGEYIDQLTSGALEDWEATYAEAMKKLEVAGNKKVTEYLQGIVDEYVAKQK